MGATVAIAILAAATKMCIRFFILRPFNAVYACTLT